MFTVVLIAPEESKSDESDSTLDECDSKFASFKQERSSYDNFTASEEIRVR